MSIFNLLELLLSGNRFIWIFCNFLLRIFKVFWLNKNEPMIINNTITISKNEIFSTELIEFHGISHNGTFIVNRSWNKWFCYTPKPVRLSMAGFKIQSWQIVWLAAELGNWFDWCELLSTSIIELDEASYVWMIGTIEFVDVWSAHYSKKEEWYVQLSQINTKWSSTIFLLSHQGVTTEYIVPCWMVQ